MAAEADLTRAVSEMNGNAIESASRRAIRLGMNAAVPAYHLADAVWTAREQLRLGVLNNLEQLQSYIEVSHCVMLRQPQMVRDLRLLGAIVDAYKHAELRNQARPVTSNKATVVVATGLGELTFGEGKYGGIDQVIVRQGDGQSRALSSVLQNVIDMWRRFLGLDLPPIGQ
jgi:hypothetical protein